MNSKRFVSPSIVSSRRTVLQRVAAYCAERESPQCLVAHMTDRVALFSSHRLWFVVCYSGMMKCVLQCVLQKTSATPVSHSLWCAVWCSMCCTGMSTATYTRCNTHINTLRAAGCGTRARLVWRTAKHTTTRTTPCTTACHCNTRCNLLQRSAHHRL